MLMLSMCFPNCARFSDEGSSISAISCTHPKAPLSLCIDPQTPFSAHTNCIYNAHFLPNATNVKKIKEFLAGPEERNSAAALRP